MTTASNRNPSEDNVEHTALQFACRKGSFEQVKYLINSGCDLDVGPDFALHLSLRKGFNNIALALLQAGADFDLRDINGDYPIHIASSMGLLDAVHALCTLGCSLEVSNATGLYPLHLAAKYGHIHIVRCLCAAGCNVDIRNRDNVTASITALKHGHYDIGELLDRLRASGSRDTYARLLVPTTRPAVRLTLRLLGHCGVGKTACVKSLTAGLFSTLFRRSSSLQSNKSRPSSPINTQIEMDVTSRQNSLSFELPPNYESTTGISVQNIDISGVGDVSVWDFSGQENYFPVYHNFLCPNPHTLTAIFFSLDDPPNVQVQQLSFWLNFLLARQPADLPTCEYGKIVIIATHVDTTRSTKTQQGEWISPDAKKTLESVRKMLPHAPNLMVNPIVVDSNVPASYGFKQLKFILSTIKQECMQQTIGTWTGLLEASLSWLVSLQKEYEQFPVLSRNQFSDLLRTQVNMLASDEHIDELLQQLHLMGEVFCIQELVVISVQWLGNHLLGELLSLQFLTHARVTGVYSTDDFQASYNQCDALGVLELLTALQLCIPVEVDDDVEYEFPIYNQTETLMGLWDSGDPRYRVTGACYAGVRLHSAPDTLHMFSGIFCHIQIELRKLIIEDYCNNEYSDLDLYQWYHGSKLCTTVLETLITLGEDDNSREYIEIKIRGPRQTSKHCFYFFEHVLSVISQAISKVAPGLLIERHVLSAHQLRVHCIEPYCYEPSAITIAALNSESTLDVTLRNADSDRLESLVQLVLFDDVELASRIQWGCALRVSALPAPCKLRVCGLLDPAQAHGRDWCLLALRLGLSQDRIAALHSHHASCTMRLLTIVDCTIGALITNLQELERADVAEILLRSAPLFKILHDKENK